MFRDRDGWRVQWTDKATGERRSRKFDSEKRAQLFELRLAEGEVPAEELVRHCPTFGEYAAVWLETYCKAEKAESQWRADAYTIKAHLVPAIGEVRLTRLRRSHLLEVRDQLRKKTAARKRHGLSNKSVNLVTSLARKIMATAVERELIGTNPFQGIKQLRLPPQRFRYWTREEREKFLAYADQADPQFSRLVRVACHTGLRLGELAALTAADVDFERRKIRVSKTFDVNLAKVMATTKGRTDEDVPMNPEVVRALEPVRFLRPSALVFDRALFWSARKRLGRLAEKADVTAIRFHDTRHTFASLLAMAGTDLMTIQALCRHKSYQMTLRYAHLHPDHLAGTTDVLCTQPARRLGARPESGGSTGT